MPLSFQPSGRTLSVPDHPGVTHRPFIRVSRCSSALTSILEPLFRPPALLQRRLRITVSGRGGDIFGLDRVGEHEGLFEGILASLDRGGTFANLRKTDLVVVRGPEVPGAADEPAGMAVALLYNSVRCHIRTGGATRGGAGTASDEGRF